MSLHVLYKLHWCGIEGVRLCCGVPTVPSSLLLGFDCRREGGNGGEPRTAIFSFFFLRLYLGVGC